MLTITTLFLSLLSVVQGRASGHEGTRDWTIDALRDAMSQIAWESLLDAPEAEIAIGWENTSVIRIADDGAPPRTEREEGKLWRSSTGKFRVELRITNRWRSVRKVSTWDHLPTRKGEVGRGTAGGGYLDDSEVVYVFDGSQTMVTTDGSVRIFDSRVAPSLADPNPLVIGRSFTPGHPVMKQLEVGGASYEVEAPDEGSGFVSVQMRLASVLKAEMLLDPNAGLALVEGRQWYRIGGVMPEKPTLEYSNLEFLKLADQCWTPSEAWWRRRSPSGEVTVERHTAVRMLEDPPREEMFVVIPEVGKLVRMYRDHRWVETRQYRDAMAYEVVARFDPPAPAIGADQVTGQAQSGAGLLGFIPTPRRESLVALLGFLGAASLTAYGLLGFRRSRAS